ncbi:MAG TPA: lytic transglycosylase domain-containing protein [Fimbriimonadaceae bacterium]
MKRLLSLIPLACAFCAAHAQTFDQYVKLRHQYKITQAVGEEALETFVGQRIMEIKGTVKGTMRVANGEVSVLLEKSNGDTIFVSCPKGAPDWLDGNEVPVRLIVNAHRESTKSDFEATMLGAAGEAQVSDYEYDLANAARASRSRTLTSRHSDYRMSRLDLPASDAAPAYAQFILNHNSHLSEDEALKIAQGVIGYSLRFGVDARLIMAMIMVESGFNPHATSRTGAMGLGQLMPGTAAGMGVTDAYDSMDNLYGTVKLIRGHLDTYQQQTGDDYQSLVLSLAAYNAGPGAVSKHGGVPPYRETQNYVKKVISIYKALCGEE